LEIISLQFLLFLSLLFWLFCSVGFDLDYHKP
jgi:hypothetical protein